MTRERWCESSRPPPYVRVCACACARVHMYVTQLPVCSEHCQSWVCVCVCVCVCVWEAGRVAERFEREERCMTVNPVIKL